ncbi:MAG: winged helix-turn-helix domain-containing protein [Gammaproteobacteria bacterium]|nr:winged helix-turn-helix domain-containing protein [Gammaproteobacteria bacterium]
MLDTFKQKAFLINDWQVLPEQGVISRGDEIVHLEPKVMEVLAYFASRAGDVISREELEQDVWRGAIIGYDAVTKTVIKLRKALKDDAKNPVYIITIPKKGYQLLATVKLTDRSVSTNTSAQLQSATKHAGMSLKHWAGFLSLIFFSSFAYWILSPSPVVSKTPTAQLKPPVILVLPFENLLEQQLNENYVDAMTENVINDLSLLSNLVVLSASTSFKYKDKNITPQQIRQQISVDFVLKGSVRKLDDNLSINIQLVDAKSAANVWGKRFSKSTGDIFSVQNDVTQHLFKQFSIKTPTNEKTYLSPRMPANLAAYDHFLSGQRLSKQQSKTSHQAARNEYRQAVKLDPGYSRAYGAIAYTLAFDYRMGWTDAPLETLDRALSLAEQATLLDPASPQTFWVLGYVQLMRKQFDAAETAVTKAITLSPNYADGYGLLALINNSQGKAEQALNYVNKGMLLNPFYTWDYPYNQGRAYYTLGRYDEAIEVLEKAATRNENAIPIKLFLAVSYIHKDRLDDAEWIAEELLAINPEISVSYTAKTIPITRTDIKQSFLADLRKTGLPD